MPTLKRKKADGTFEFVQLTGIDVKELKDQVTDFNEELAQNQTDLKERGINVNLYSTIQSAIDSAKPYDVIKFPFW